MVQDADISGALFAKITAEDGSDETITISQLCAATSFDWVRYPIGSPVVLMTRAAYDRLVGMAREAAKNLSCIRRDNHGCPTLIPAPERRKS